MTCPLRAYGKSIIDSEISSTCSLDVQSHFHQLPSKRQQQCLNKSLVLRIKSIDAMNIVCLFLGSPCASLPAMGKYVVMVAACILEQMNERSP